MQDSVLAVGILVYSAAGLDAWRVLPGAAAFKWKLTVLFPGLYLGLTLAACLMIAPLRRALRRHLWISYRTGFGQTAVSVLGGLGMLVAIAGLIVWQAHGAARGGTSPGGAFSGYGAGLGLLIAQAILVRTLETDPNLRERLEDADPP
jgi:hypothetical protein